MSGHCIWVYHLDRTLRGRSSHVTRRFGSGPFRHAWKTGRPDFRGVPGRTAAGSFWGRDNGRVAAILKALGIASQTSSALQFRTLARDDQAPVVRPARLWIMMSVKDTGSLAIAPLLEQYRR